ncbi:MAG: hypothetical protein JRJ78_13180 [Deltaproteobacteria bacterium]|nr:hypothetical protein [Deltaproteobacteria bacterium]
MKSYKPAISQEYFEELLKDAIHDLQKSGLPDEKVYALVKDLFGSDYAQRFCGNL